MSAEGNTPLPTPAPSVFISYASEDRAAARALRDALLAVGLDVWYDENELTGGDAWDQKIRRQIRDCDYFMPLISATTERRKEGYFRREWRLASERTMDMADDVLFLLPVAIDDTSEIGARVPDRFLTVQWLRAPGGQHTPAFDALAQRLLAGEHHIAARPPMVTRPPMMMPAAAAPAEPAHAPPKMPEFPHPPEKSGVGHWLKFMAEVIWWMVTATWTVFMRLPRWVRIILGLWLIFMLITTCSRESDPRPKNKKHPDGPSVAEVERAASATAEQIAAVLEKNANAKDWGKIGEDLARRFGGAPERLPAGGSGRKTLVFAPFAPDPENAKATQFAQNVFSRCYGQIILARRNEVAISPILPVGPGDEALASLGQQQRAEFVLGPQLTKSPEGERKLVVRLIHAKDGAVTWSGEYHAGGDARETGAKIAETILQHLPAPPPPRKKG